MISRTSGVLLIRGACVHGVFKQDACEHQIQECALRYPVTRCGESVGQRMAGACLFLIALWQCLDIWWVFSVAATRRE